MVTAYCLPFLLLMAALLFLPGLLLTVVGWRPDLMQRSMQVLLLLLLLLITLLHFLLLLLLLFLLFLLLILLLAYS